MHSELERMVINALNYDCECLPLTNTSSHLGAYVHTHTCVHTCSAGLSSFMDELKVCPLHVSPFSAAQGAVVAGIGTREPTCPGRGCTASCTPPPSPEGHSRPQSWALTALCKCIFCFISSITSPPKVQKLEVRGREITCNTTSPTATTVIL